MGIGEACALKQPEYLVITLGVNGVADMSEDYFKECYTGVINMVRENSPDTKIICNSIYPVGRNYAHLGSINNDKINAANEWIKEVAAETGTRYSDTAPCSRTPRAGCPTTCRTATTSTSTPRASSLYSNTCAPTPTCKRSGNEGIL